MLIQLAVIVKQHIIILKQLRYKYIICIFSLTENNRADLLVL